MSFSPDVDPGCMQLDQSAAREHAMHAHVMNTKREQAAMTKQMQEMQAWQQAAQAATRASHEEKERLLQSLAVSPDHARLACIHVSRTTATCMTCQPVQVVQAWWLLLIPAFCLLAVAGACSAA